jgi:hypothetical protein
VTGSNRPGVCLICGQRVSRFWGIGASYVPPDVTDDSALSDISVAGFCRAHRADVIDEVRALVEAKGAVTFFMDPPVELRTHEIDLFIAYMSSGLG